MTSVCRMDVSMDFEGQNVVQLIAYNGRNIENPVFVCLFSHSIDLAVNIIRTKYVIPILYITSVHEYFSKRDSVCVCT